jgi:hypothetical protein
MNLCVHQLDHRFSQPTKQNHRPATQPTHATLQPGLQHVPGRPAKATFSEPDPLLWFQSPHPHVIPAKVPVRAAVCPFTQAARTQPYLRRARARAMPCRPRPPALPPRPQQSGLASAANRDMCSTGQRRSLAADEAFSGRGTARVPGAATCLWLQILPKARCPS